MYIYVPHLHTEEETGYGAEGGKGVGGWGIRGAEKRKRGAENRKKWVWSRGIILWGHRT